MFPILLCLALFRATTAFPQVQFPNNDVKTYVLPKFDNDPGARAKQLETHRAGYLYGPSLMGNSSFYPTGELGDAMVQDELKYLVPESEEIQSFLNMDTEAARDAITQVSEHVSLRPSFTKFYHKRI